MPCRKLKRKKFVLPNDGKRRLHPHKRNVEVWAPILDAIQSHCCQKGHLLNWQLLCWNCALLSSPAGIVSHWVNQWVVLNYFKLWQALHVGVQCCAEPSHFMTLFGLFADVTPRKTKLWLWMGRRQVSMFGPCMYFCLFEFVAFSSLLVDPSSFF